MLPVDQTLSAFIPPGAAGDYVLAMNASRAIQDLLRTQLGYGHVVDAQTEPFDLERDFYPYPNAHFKAVVCCDLLESLTHDPMHMMDEIHRILRPRCDLILTTRRYATEQVRGLLENCGLEVTRLENGGERVYAAGRKVGPVRERYPAFLYPAAR